MPMSAFVPEALRHYLRLVRLQFRYPGRTVMSPHVGLRVDLGIGCTVDRDVEIRDGVSIGSYSYVNAGTFIASGRIGKFCSIGRDCQLGAAEHPLAHLSTSPRLYGQNNLFGLLGTCEEFPSPPVIGHDVWIASGATILQGVRIGSGAVIGAGAVVTKDVPPYAIAAGVPARPIRSRFNEATIEHLLDLRWWDRPLAEIASLLSTAEAVLGQHPEVRCHG